MRKYFTQRGQILMGLVVFGSLGVFIIVGLVSWAVLTNKAAVQLIERELAIQIAEAGTDYYRWHLAHAPEDFQDGTGQPGPYVHDFYDKDNNIIGQFTLDITAPPLGSTLVTIQSSGKVSSNDYLSRTIKTQLAKPSLAKYAVVANAIMRFGEGTEVYGPIHSNGGIRFDGLAHNIISSAVEDYDDPDHGGANEFGVHTHILPVDPLPPNPVPQRPDVFEAGRQFPLPAVDFTGITADLAQMKSDAQSDGFYRTSSGALGYHIVLNTNDTFNLYQVTSYVNPPWGCSYSQSGWSTWSINNQSYIGTYAFPINGLIFLEDHIFIDGQINTARLSIAAATFPDSPQTRKNIIVNNDLSYTNYDGQDVIGLIAQGNFNIGMASEDDLKIDGAIIAQNGRVGRHYYPGPWWWYNRCSPYHQRQVVTLYGMIATNQRYGFAYTDGNGYQIRNLNYDANLLYSPPPSFPLASEQYVTLSWDEVR